MSANQTTTTPTATPVPSAPTVTLSVTESAAGEIKKFMSSEEGLPESAGLRVRVVPGGCSGFQYSLNIEEESRQGDFILDDKGVRLFVHSLSSHRLANLLKTTRPDVMSGRVFLCQKPDRKGGQLWFELSLDLAPLALPYGRASETFCWLTWHPTSGKNSESLRHHRSMRSIRRAN